MAMGKDNKEKIDSLRNQYKQSLSGNLTTYAALIGDGFSSKVNLLAQVIRDVHHPSLGRYKERLLAATIKQFIPRSFDVGTGFVLFPTERVFLGGVPEHYDPRNMSDHVASRQCDIMVYDVASSPVVFRDDDFVVLRPESVRAIVEVKGTLNSREADSIVDWAIDFGLKWKKCNEFYVTHNQPPLHQPYISALAWQLGLDSRSRPLIDGNRFRERIARGYRDKIHRSLLGRARLEFPILDSAHIYNICSIHSCVYFEDHVEVTGDPSTLYMGWVSRGGRFLRVNEMGKPELIGDRTIATLLAGIHWSLGSRFNRFFSYADETNSTKLVPEQQGEFSRWLELCDDVWIINDSKTK